MRILPLLILSIYVSATVYNSHYLLLDAAKMPSDDDKKYFCGCNLCVKTYSYYKESQIHLIKKYSDRQIRRHISLNLQHPGARTQCLDDIRPFLQKPVDVPQQHDEAPPLEPPMPGDDQEQVGKQLGPRNPDPAFFNDPDDDSYSSILHGEAAGVKS